jgi:hypothetical protein
MKSLCSLCVCLPPPPSLLGNGSVNTVELGVLQSVYVV